MTVRVFATITGNLEMTCGRCRDTVWSSFRKAPRDRDESEDGWMWSMPELLEIADNHTCDT